MPKIYSRRKGAVPAPPDAVYCGRGSYWGNPFVMGQDGDRDEVCDKFEAYALDRIGFEPDWLRELVGKDLVCWCKPKPESATRCHCETLERLANDGRCDK